MGTSGITCGLSMNSSKAAILNVLYSEFEHECASDIQEVQKKCTFALLISHNDDFFTALNASLRRDKLEEDYVVWQRDKLWGLKINIFKIIGGQVKK